MDPKNSIRKRSEDTLRNIDLHTVRAECENLLLEWNRLVFGACREMVVLLEDDVKLRVHDNINLSFNGIFGTHLEHPNFSASSGHKCTIRYSEANIDVYG